MNILDDEDEIEFSINKQYAKSYDTWRRKEEIQKLKDRFGEVAIDSSDSEEEDDDAEEITPQKERDFLIALSNIKSKNPKIYQKDVNFFQPEEETEEEELKTKKKKKKEKPMYLKDYERQIVTEKGGKFTDDEDDDEEGDDLPPPSPTYLEEQEDIKKSFHQALENHEGDADDDQVLKKKEKSREEKEQEEREYVKWLKEQGEEEEDTSDKQELSALKKIWTDPALDDGEKFLRDYILNKGYVHKGDGTDVVDLSGDEDFSEEERLLDQQDDFERKYNFRFEEPDQEFIKRYPRTVGSSLRQKDTSRAEKRKERKERKDEEKQKKNEELKRLKNLKKQEIMEQLDKLKHVTGNVVVGFDLDDLDGDFDPDQHDQLMKKIFSDEYEGLEEDASKPELYFEYDEDLNSENWDEWGGEWEGDENDWLSEGGAGAHCEDPDFVMDADYDPGAHQKKKDKKKKKKGITGETAPSRAVDPDEETGKRKGKKQSKFAEALKQDKPVFDPDDKTFEEYLEEYYRLDYEDLIGDLPCRFKYRSVVPNDFGLSTEEILSAREQELNQWVSVKKTSQYRSEAEELSDVHSYKIKARNTFKKERIFQSLKQEEEEDTEDTPEGVYSNSQDSNPETNKPKQKLSKKKLKKLKYLSERGETLEASTSKREHSTVPYNLEIPKHDEWKEKDDKKVNLKEGRKKKSKHKNEKKKEEQNEKKNEGESAKANEQSPGNKPETGRYNGDAENKGDFNVSAKDNSKNTKTEFQSGQHGEEKRKRKRKIIEELRNKKKRKFGEEQLTDARFRAYGLNPKKQRYRLAQQKKKTKNSNVTPR